MLFLENVADEVAVKKLLITFIALLGIPFVLWGIFLLVIQLLYWFKTGAWSSVSLLDIFVPPPDTEFRFMRLVPHDLVPGFFWGSVPWLDNPSNWFGAYKLVHGFLEIVPLSLALIILGFTISLQSFRFEQQANETSAEQNQS